MGTCCDIHISDQNHGICVIHKNQDGDIYSTGLNLCEYLKNKKIVNGHHGYDDELNGANCAAASIVAFLKNEVGNVYLYPYYTPDYLTDYTYIIDIVNFKIKMAIFECDKLIFNTSNINNIYNKILYSKNKNKL